MNWVLRWYLRQVLSKPIIRAINWSPEDIRDFELFCRTRCGMRLFEFLRQVVATQTFQAVYRDSVSANARARGMQDVLALLHRLRVFPPEESIFSGLEDEEQTESEGIDASKSDRWRWLGGSGAIG